MPHGACFGYQVFMQSSRTLLLSLAPLLFACQGGQPGDCAALKDPVKHENCLFERATLERGKGPDALELFLKSVPEATSRDLIRLRLAIADPAQAGPLCDRAETPPVKEKCRQVLGRPHLRSRPKPPEDPSTENPGSPENKP